MAEDKEPIIHAKGDATTVQMICRNYGTRCWNIRGMKAFPRNANRYFPDSPVFTQDEIDLIDTICQDAEERAERNYREERQQDAEASGRTSSEHRQYTGK